MKEAFENLTTELKGFSLVNIVPADIPGGVNITLEIDDREIKKPVETARDAVINQGLKFESINKFSATPKSAVVIRGVLPADETPAEPNKTKPAKPKEEK